MVACCLAQLEEEDGRTDTACSADPFLRGGTVVLDQLDQPHRQPHNLRWCPCAREVLHEVRHTLVHGFCALWGGVLGHGRSEDSWCAGGDGTSLNPAEKNRYFGLPTTVAGRATVILLLQVPKITVRENSHRDAEL